MKRLLLLMSGGLAALSVGAAELKLLVHGKDLKGKEVRVALYSSAQGFPRQEDEARTVKSVATGNEVEMHFSGLPPGEYAVSAFADSNGNARLDNNFIGVPREPYGFSRDARGLLGPPSFAEAAFRIGDTDVTQSIHLH